MTGFSRGFGPDDLPPTGDVPAPELATSLRIGRELDSFAAAERVEPRADFGSRVMSAVAAEPAPRPAAVVGEALRRGRPIAFFVGVRDAWRVAFSGGRPAAARAQAFAIVLVAAIGLASLGGLTAVGVGALLSRSDSGPTPGPSPTLPLPSPSPTVMPSPTPSLSPSPSPTPSVTPTRTPRATPTDTAEPEETPERDETPEPDETPRPGDGDHSGPG